jgi:hypothetical protein
VVVGYYQKAGNPILKINADQPIDQVTQAVLARLDSLKK